MAIYIYRSTDTSAPQLTGQAGKMIGVLDACLVNGYGAKAGMGQTKPYAGTNLASYKIPTGTSQSYLAIDDAGTQTCRFRGFQTMTAAGPAVANGTHPFPTDAQVNGSLYIYKSNSADAVTRPQVLISNGKIFYLWIDNPSNGQAAFYAFGDISSYIAGDLNPCILIGLLSDYKCLFPEIAHFGQPNTIYTHVIGLKYDQSTWSSSFGKVPARGHTAWQNIGQNTGSYLYQPDPIFGGQLISPIYIHEGGAGTAVLRGWLPGIYAPCYQPVYPTSMITNGDIITGDAGTDLAGKTFETFTCKRDTLMSTILVETSDTWDSKWWM